MGNGSWAMGYERSLTGNGRWTMADQQQQWTSNSYTNKMYSDKQGDVTSILTVLIYMYDVLEGYEVLKYDITFCYHS